MNHRYAVRASSLDCGYAVLLLLWIFSAPTSLCCHQINAEKSRENICVWGAKFEGKSWKTKAVGSCDTNEVYFNTGPSSCSLSKAWSVAARGYFEVSPFVYMYIYMYNTGTRQEAVRKFLFQVKPTSYPPPKAQAWSVATGHNFFQAEKVQCLY